jgi:hypothetical protein
VIKTRNILIIANSLSLFQELTERKSKGELVWILASKRLGWWPAVVQKLEILKPDLKEDITTPTSPSLNFLTKITTSLLKIRQLQYVLTTLVKRKTSLPMV